MPQGRTLLRGFLGGLLMGLANLVPGVSGGTMLVATGVYGHFVHAVARCSTLRLRLGPVVMLSIIVFGALMMILLGAGVLSELVRDHRWIMYSLFIGFTLGGVPLLWSMTRPMDARSTLGMISGIVAMAVLAMLEGIGGIWRTIARLGRVVPRSLRNIVYRFIAKRRYGWFGDADACRVPSAEDVVRFLP